MSALTPCNLCTLRQLKKRYGNSVTVTPVPDVKWPKGVEVRTKDGKFLAMFIELTRECVC